MIPTLLFVLLTLTSSAEVDFLNILLPELQEPIPTFPLQLITAQDGCYHWTSSQPQTVRVSPHNPKAVGCSRQALVSVGKVGQFPSSIYVSADEANSQSQMKIPVRIRKLNKITIASKSRMMNIKEVQRLELFAFDKDENTFTSLEGLRFKWRLEQANNILELVPLVNAKLYLPLRTRENIEKNGYQSDMIVVKALAPGNLKVTATCIEPGYEFLTDEITISVHERFQLKPGPVIRMAPQTSLQLKLLRPSGQEIQVPQSYYQIISCDDFIINSALYLTVPDSPSRCTIKVQDTRTKPPYESSTDVIVEYADQIRIVTSPLIIVGVQSPYQIQLLREGVTLLGQHRNIEVYSDFNFYTSSKMILADRKMTGIISARLGSLKKEATINSFLPVTAILPNNYLHIPVGQFFKLRLLGGTGLYDFELNHEIATISSIHVLHARAVGDIIVTIRDRNHLANTATFRLKVSDLLEIHSLQAEKEVNRDQWGNVYVIGKNSGHQTFTQCSHSTFTFSLPTSNLDFDKKVNQIEAIRDLQDSESVFVQEAIGQTSLFKGKQQEIINSYQNYVYYEEIEANELKQYIINLENYGICRVIRFKSIIILQENALIRLDGEYDVKTKIPLRVYNHITTTIQGDDHQFLMTPESSLSWLYTGGSYHWPNSHKKIYINGRSENDAKVPIITCPSRQVPAQTYQLRVFNQQSRRLLFPTEQRSNITIICKYPKKIHLKLEQGDAFDELFIQSERQVKGDVEVSDEFNQFFYNSSNVYYQFSPISGTISSYDQHFTYKDNGINDTVTIFTEQLKSGLKYKRVATQLSIFIVPPISVKHPLSPKDRSKNVTIITLYTPKKPYRINIHDLHSQVHVQCTKAVSCSRGQDYIAVQLLKLGRGYVTVKDKKMYGSETWNFEFIIVEADQVKVKASRDYVQEGQQFELTVENYHNGQLISPHTYEPSYLQALLPRNFRIIEQKGNTFVIRPQHAGQFEVQAENTYPRVIRTQQPFKVNVYKQIQPNIESTTEVQEDGFLMIQAKAAILIGCRRIIQIKGGPKQMAIQAKTEHSNIKIEKRGRTFSISSNKQGKYQVLITANYKGNKIALIILTINISKIQSIELQSIEEPVVDSAFRIHPRFKVGSEDLSDCVCDFIYLWGTTNGNVKLGESMSFGYIDAAGVNATAKKAGTQIINLEVKSKQSGQSLGKVSKYLDIIQDIGLYLPTYINRDPCCPPTSIIMPPSSRYSFDQLWSVSPQGSLVTVGEKKNVINSGKKLGYGTVTLARTGHRPLHVHVEIKHISGIFVDNFEGFIGIEPQSTLTVPIYLQDNNGRLFISPIQELNLAAFSSNSEIVEVTNSPEKHKLNLRSKNSGICIISVILPGRNLIDSIVISVGSALSPGKQVKILQHGTVQFSSIMAQDKWVSSNPSIASINAQTGQMKALQPGITRVSQGELTSTVEVLKIKSVKQLLPEQYQGSTLKIVFQAFWLSSNGLEEIPFYSEDGPINNHFHPQCNPNNRYLTTKIDIFEENGFERFQCTISAAQDQKLPEAISVTIEDGHRNAISTFEYRVKPHFNLPKYVYTLSPNSPKALIDISTNKQINVGQKNGDSKWITSSFNEQRQQQTIKIDMSNQKTDLTWYLDLSCEGQKEQISLVFKAKEKGEQSHSFWSFSLDWPDYLILAMALVFGTICYFQYHSDQKYKLS